MAKKKAVSKKKVARKSKPSSEGKSTYTEYNVTPEDFIRAWETSSTPDEVAAKLNMPKEIVHARASKYRKGGVKLKDLGVTRGRRGIDVDSLNELIESLRDKELPPRKTGSDVDPAFIQDVVKKVIAELGKKK